MNQRFDEESLLWLEEESAGGGPSSGKKMAAFTGGGIVGTAILGKALSPLAKRLARRTGLPPAQAKMLLTAVAPVVISAVSAAMAKRRNTAQRHPTIQGEPPEPGGHQESKGLLGTHRHRR